MFYPSAHLRLGDKNPISYLIQQKIYLLGRYGIMNWHIILIVFVNQDDFSHKMGKLIRRTILEAIIQHLGKYNSFSTLYKRMDI